MSDLDQTYHKVTGRNQSITTARPLAFHDLERLIADRFPWHRVIKTLLFAIVNFKTSAKKREGYVLGFVRLYSK